MTISRVVINTFGVISIISGLLTMSLYLFRAIYIYILKNNSLNNDHIKTLKNINIILPFLTKYHSFFWFVCICFL